MSEFLLKLCKNKTFAKLITFTDEEAKYLKERNQMVNGLIVWASKKPRERDVYSIFILLIVS